MEIQVYSRTLDESTYCPLCAGAMYFIEGEFNDDELQFNECSFCSHRVFPMGHHTCHCEKCTEKRKKIIRETSQEELRVLKSKKKNLDINEAIDIHQLTFMQKLFLLSILDEYVVEGHRYDEWIDIKAIRNRNITPNYLFQNQLIKNLIKEDILKPTEFSDECSTYYLNIRMEGYTEPTMFSVTTRLRQLFYSNLSQGIPFKTAEEVKDSLFYVLYQEIVQFAQFSCKTWGVQISGSKGFNKFCVVELERLAVGQILYMVQNALDYLHSKNLLQERNEKFINTNYLKSTLEKYRKRALEEKWEAFTLPRPTTYPISKMTEILLFKFLGYDERAFVEPINHFWEKVAPRLQFYSTKRCMNCGGNDLQIEYDAGDQVSMTCHDCNHQDHYFIKN